MIKVNNKLHLIGFEKPWALIWGELENEQPDSYRVDSYRVGVLNFIFTFISSNKIYEILKEKMI